MTLASLSVTCSESATISNRTVCMLFFVTYNGWNIILKCIIIHGEKTSLACVQIYYFNYINVTIASNNLQENNKYHISETYDQLQFNYFYGCFPKIGVNYFTTDIVDMAVSDIKIMIYCLLQI